MNHLTPHIDCLTEEAVMVRESARHFFSTTNVKSIRSQIGRRPGYRKSVWQQMVDMGWLGWRVEPELEGCKLSFMSGVLLHEELGAAAAPEPLLASAVLSAGVLSRSSNPIFNTECLTKLASGANSFCLVWQAQTSNAHVKQHHQVTAVTEGNQTSLTGRAHFASMPDADFFLIYAKAENGYGIYQVEKNDPGLQITYQQRIDGLFWAELTLSDIKVNTQFIVIDPAHGESVLNDVLDEGRLVLSAELVGAMSEIFKITLDYMRTRKQFGSAIGSFQALQHRAVDLAALIEITRSVVLRSAQIFDETNHSVHRGIAASQAKARASSSAIDVISGCIQLHGGIAYTEECDIGLYLKRAMVQAAWLDDARFHRDRFGKLRSISNNINHSDIEAPIWLNEMRKWVEENLPDELRFPARRMSWREAHSWHKKLYSKGWVAPAWPKEYGGVGLSPYEELLLHDLYDEFGINIFQNMGLTTLGPVLQRYGTIEQKNKYFPDILSGQTYWCQGYSEPEAGSDLASLRTSAVLVDDHFIVNGQKIWTSLAHEADMMFLLVRTDPSAKKQQGISFLLVDMKTRGITINPIVNLTGSKDFCGVFFDNVKVPKENLVGNLNQGWTMAKAALGSERVMIGHPRFAKSSLNMLKQLAVARNQEMDPEFKSLFNALSLDVADLEALYVRYLNVLRDGKQLGAEVSILKIWSSETWQRIVNVLRELAGVQGTMNDQEPIGNGSAVHSAVQFLHARPSTIYGGTNEIQRNILAKSLLNLPMN